jgi:hypothetical protein
MTAGRSSALIPSAGRLSRPDLAESRLEGLARARSYRPLIAMTATCASVAVRAEPSSSGAAVDSLMFGEVFDVLDIADGWAWGRARRDGETGHVEIGLLKAAGELPTHRIAVEAEVFAEPGDERPVGRLGMNALARPTTEKDGWSLIPGLGWIESGRLVDFHRFETDPAAVAERFLGAPWRAGGRTREGIDGLGLARQALYACGRALSEGADAGATAEAGRGDLILWDHHAGIMVDERRLIHADPEAGVILEALEAVEARLGPGARISPSF